MALTTAPLMSLDASGSVAKTIVFSKWKGRNYVRQHVTPSNPRTPSQYAQRAMMAFLSKAWNDLSAGDKATWQSLASISKVSTFNAFVKYNLQLWTQGQTPTQVAPPALANSINAATIFGVTGGVRQLTIEFSSSSVANNWGAIIYLSTTPAFTVTKQTTRLVADETNWATDSNVFVIVPQLEPGSWYHSFSEFTTDGVASTPAAVAGPTVVT